MNGNDFWPWLVMGLVPYYINWQHGQKGRQMIKVQALFWSLEIQQLDNQNHGWTIQVPFIERMRRVLWKVVTLLRDEPIEIR